jgi:putative transposase
LVQWEGGDGSSGRCLYRKRAAEANRISKSTVHRLFQTFAVQPHRSKTCKLSTDPFFVEMVREIVGLYLNPPDQ